MKRKRWGKNWSFKSRVSPEKTKFARNMRKNPTKAEALLWSKLKAKKTGYKFTRQKVILGWIVDFYCPKVRLVVEVDGKYHELELQKKKDNLRDLVMSEHGFSILRVTNRCVMGNVNDVAMRIRCVADTLL
jgi:very-short-patch-repair endonuclease